jgi:hypothetical protein
MSTPDNAPTITEACADPCKFAARPELYRQAVLELLCQLYSGQFLGAANTNTGTVAVPTTAGGTQMVAARATRRKVTLINNSTTPVYYGSGIITSANATLPGVVGASIDIYSRDQIKALSSSGTVNVSFVEVYD